MEFNSQFLGTPDLEVAIDRHPLVIAPEMLLIDAIALMSQAPGSSCLLFGEENSLDLFAPNKIRSSCALIMDEQKILGILTERDIVRLTAAEIEFAGVEVAQVMTQPVVTLDQENFKDIFAALFLFRRYRIRHLPVIDGNRNLIGIISPRTIRQAMRPANLLKLRRVADVMTRQVVHTALMTSVLRVAQIMTNKKVSCVVITKENTQENILIPTGIITERDIIQFQSLQLKLGTITAQEVMSAPLFLLSPEEPLFVAYQEMERRRVRRLVVSWNWGRGLGIITQTNMLRIFDPMEMYGVIETLQQTVQQLQQEKAELLAMVNSQRE